LKAKGATKMIKRILIVDDSPTERHVLNDLLTKAGFEVVAKMRSTSRSRRSPT